MATIVERIGKYAKQLSFKDLSPDVVDYAKRILLDSLGCGFGGLQGEATKIVFLTAQGLGGTGQATILGRGIKTSAPLAALANGVAIRYLDFNDGYFGPAWTAHPSDNIATILAAAEYCNCSGKNFLTAMVAAYETQIRFADLPVPRNLWHGGWHHTAACAYASAVGVGKLMGLSASQIAHAIALSGARANTFSEIRHGDIPMDKALSAPIVASHSIVYALLAQKGFTGSSTLLEGPYGFRYAVAGGVDVEPLVPNVEEFRIFKINLKPYPVENMTIAMEQAALELKSQYKINPDEIQKIRIIAHEEALTKPSWDPKKLNPTTKETADHSFYYCVAVALTAGEVTPHQFTKKWLRNKTVAKLMAQCTIESKDEFTKLFKKGARPAAVEVTTPRGVFYREVLYPKGDPHNPMTWVDVNKKFVTQAEAVLGSELTKEVMDRTFALDKEASMSSFGEMLGGLNMKK
jgi:2-methylcitrate dehydratase